MPPRPPATESRERIYRAAARLFSETGYRATSMRDIAAALGMKAGSLYAHISGKEDLLWEIIVRIADEFDEALTPTLAPAAPAEDRLRAALEAYVNVIARNIEMSTVLFSEWRHLPPERQTMIRTRRDAVEAVFREILRQGTESGEFSAGTQVNLTAVLALSGANWLPNWYRQDGPLSPQDVADTFVALLLHGILPRTPAPGPR